MIEDGYYYYKRFVERPPLLTIEWHDTETSAVGWLVINSLRNGAAGGGTRIRQGGTREEAIFLAKTMEIKFRVSGPPIGGAKSLINLGPQDPRKEGVLCRWFESIGPYLHHCYGTGGDLGVDEIREVIPLTSRLLCLRHPQEGIVRGHVKANERGYRRILGQLKTGVEMPVSLKHMPDGRFKIADLITGFGLTRALHYFCGSRGDGLKGRRVLIEGFGAVGGSAAYYLTEAGARIVGVLSLSGRRPEEYRWVVDKAGLDVCDLLHRRDGAHLPVDSKSGVDPVDFWTTEAEIFVPAAASHTITLGRLDQLRSIGIEMIVSGANNPFAEIVPGETTVQQEADRSFTVIPDFIANCGMARTFAYLMDESAQLDAPSIFCDVDQAIQRVMRTLLDGHWDNTGLLARAYSRYVPRDDETTVGDEVVVLQPKVVHRFEDLVA